MRTLRLPSRSAPVTVSPQRSPAYDTHADPDTDGRFLSRAACQALATRVIAMATGGGETRLEINSRWTGNVRWARNDISTSGDTQVSRVEIGRSIHRASGGAYTNALSDDALRACVARAEAMLQFQRENPDTYPDPPKPIHPHLTPTLWFDRTIELDDVTRASIADRAIGPAKQAQLLAAGYLAVGANGRAVIHSDGLFRYYPYTTVQCTITVRDPKGQGSGWAGVDWNDWARVDVEHLAQTALDKCLRSRNPVAVEPGRYTAILEPQAVCDLVFMLVDWALARGPAENGMGPFADPAKPGSSRIGQRVVDPRITLGIDPMDPDCGFVPFDGNGEPFQPVNWIEHGILKALSYERTYGVQLLGRDSALPNPYAFRLSGGTSTIDEMIASTARGLVVTRFNDVQLLDRNSLLCTGTTRDGVWLVEHGAVTKPVKNFRFTESPMFVLNNVEQLGAPQRVFHPGSPVVVPPLKARDFSFTSLIDAI